MPLLHPRSRNTYTSVIEEPVDFGNKRLSFFIVSRCAASCSHLSDWWRLQAFTGADELFLVTDFFAEMSYEGEYQQGKNAIDAAKAV